MWYNKKEMKRKIIYIFPIFLVIAICLPVIFSSSKDKGVNLTAFNNFSDKYLELISEYSDEEKIVYKVEKDDLNYFNNEYLISVQQFANVTGDDFCDLGEILEINHEEYNIKFNRNDKYYTFNDDQKISIKSNISSENYEVSLEGISEGLGYSIIEKDEHIEITRDFQTKRLMVFSDEKKIDTYGAVKVVDGYKNLHILQYETELEAKQAYESFKIDSDIEKVYLDKIHTLSDIKTEQINTGFSASTSNYYSWGASTMGIDDYNQFLKFHTLRDVTVAVLDTGIDTDHSMFDGRIDFTNAKSFVSNNNSYEDDHETTTGSGHGTHVSGIIADLTPDSVKILPLKVLNKQGETYSSTVYLAMEYVINLKKNGNNSIVAMNISLGGDAEIGSDDYNGYVNQINNAYNNGIFSIVAAGNEKQNVKNVTPANVSNAITVSAIAKNGTSYEFASNYSNYGEYIDFCAPGTAIYSAKKGGGTVGMSGTSMATPHVAAAIALLYSYSDNNFQSMADVYNVLVNQCKDLGTSGKDKYYGYGYIDLSDAYATIVGNVEFSNKTDYFEEVFVLNLSYEDNLQGDYEIKIYYTTDGSTPNENSKLYSNGIYINSSVKITAVAYVYGSNNYLIQKSNISSMTYYYFGYDLETDYEVQNGVIVAYKGTSTELTIPKIVNTETVTAVGEYAFSNSNIVSVTLPNTITTIEDYAFYNCRSLETIYAPSVKTIGISSFKNCYRLKNVTNDYFPKLEYIDLYGFENCYSLNSIDLTSLVEIDSNAFSMYSGLTATNLVSVNLPNLESLGEYAFNNCTKITSFTAGKVERIGAFAFYGCNLSTIDLPSAEYVGSYAFYGNTNLSSVKLDNVLVLSDGVFRNNAKLTEISLPSVEYLGLYCFAECSNIVEMNMPKLKCISAYALSTLEKLNTLNVPSLRKINIYGIYNCTSLTSLNLPSIEIIDYYGIYQHSTTELYLSENLTKINKINVSSTCKIYGVKGTQAEIYATKNNIEFIENNKPDYLNYKIVGGEVYILGYNKEYSGNIIIPTYIEGYKVTRICENAFKDCSNNIVLNLYELLVLENKAFYNCENLLSVNIPNIKEIGESVFYNCQNLFEVNIKNVEKIGSQAFNMCTSLKEIELNGRITEIGIRSLGYNGIGLNKNFVIYDYSDTLTQTYATTNGINFTAIDNEIPYYYYNTYVNQNGETEAYISYVSKNFDGVVVLPNECNGYKITKIGDEAFKNCNFITEVVLPETIKIIEEEAFAGCQLLEKINLENVTSILYGAFENCSSLKEVNATKLSKINQYVFYGCLELEKVDIENVTTIDTAGFAYCTNLIEIDMHNVKIIEDDAFSSCYLLSKVLLLNVQNIGDSFQKCFSLSSIYLGKNITTISSSAFDNVSSNFKIYGFTESYAQTFANRYDYDFVELNNIILNKDLEIRNFVSADQTNFKFEINVSGFDLTYNWYKTNKDFTNTSMLATTKVNYYEVEIASSLNSIFYVEVIDWSKNKVVSAYSEIVIENATAYNVEISTDNNGNVYYNKNKILGSFKVLHGENITFKIVGNEGYIINKVLLDGNNKGSQPTYILSVYKNHTLHVEFKIINLNLNINIGENGTATTVGSIKLNYGANYSIAIFPNSGYKVDKILINDIEVKIGDSTSNYKIEKLKDKNSKEYVSLSILKINEDFDIDVTFDERTYFIKIDVEGNGRILFKSGDNKVKYGENKTIEIVTTIGNRLTSLKINGEEVKVKNGVYTIENIEDDIIIEATFEKTFSTVVVVAILLVAAILILLVILSSFKKKKQQKNNKN